MTLYLLKIPKEPSRRHKQSMLGIDQVTWSTYFFLFLISAAISMKDILVVLFTESLRLASKVILLFFKDGNSLIWLPTQPFLALEVLD